MRLAATCRTASGLLKIINRLLQEMSILKNLFRSFPQTAYLSGKCTHTRQPIKFAGRSKFGKNTLANEKYPDHAFLSHSYNLGVVLGLSSSLHSSIYGVGNMGW